MLDAFGLINMNGRVYDPVIARFLSPDNYVQSPTSSQGFNRYSYCLNNPLVYTDPSGEFVHLIIGAVIGGTINWMAHGAEFSWKGLGYFGIGAAVGAIGAGVGVGIQTASAGAAFGAGFVGSSQGISTIISVGYTSSFVTGAAVGAGAGFAGGFTTGFGNGLMGGQNFGQALWSGTKSGIIGGLSGAAIGGLTNGISAARRGRDFWDGFDYQKSLDAMVTREGINNPNSKFLVANLKNAKLVNETFNSNLTKVSGNKIYLSPDGSIYSEFGVNFGTQSKGNLTLISKQVIRDKALFSLTDVVRHEGTHQLQILAGMTARLDGGLAMEYGAYMTNILNPATSSTISKVFNILVNDWSIDYSTLWETILNIYPYGPIP
jgi:RHS repeat-associated protein